MKSIFRIAFRNLREHRTKTYIIGMLIALGVIILVIGNSLIDSTAEGVRLTFIDSYTGDIMISGESEGEWSLFGATGSNAMNKMSETPVIPEITRVHSYLDNYPGISGWTNQVSGFSLLREPDSNEDKAVFTFLFGIQPDNYQALFPNITLLTGEILSGDREGIMLTIKQAEKLEEEYGHSFTAGDKLQLQGLSNSSGIKIRELEIVGIFEFNQSMNNLDSITYIDVQNARALFGMTLGNSGEIELSKEETVLLETDFFSDDLFGEDLFSEIPSDKTFLNEEELINVLGDKTQREHALEIDTGAWHFILVKVSRGTSAQTVMNDLNLWFEKEGLSAKAVDWRAAAGGFAQMANIIKGVFTGAIIVLAIVALIIIMNTLVISVIERINEIGTMRALGAQKSFVRNLFNAEILLICLIFGILGIVIASVVLLIMGHIGIGGGDSFLSVLFAGQTVHPNLNPGNLFSTLLIVMIVGWLANLYPLSVALKVEPVKAIQTE